MNNRIREAFDTIHADEAIQEKTKAFLQKKCYQPSKRRRSPIRYAIVSLCCLFTTGFGIGGYCFYTLPVAAISVDINPSVELYVSRLDKVVSIECYDADAQKIVDSLELKNQEYEDAIQILLGSEALSSYLTDDAQINITIACDNAEKNQEMQEEVVECTGQYSNLSCNGANMEEADAAHEAGLSVGKYRAYLELHALDDSVTTEDVKDLTMREIRDWISHCSDDQNGTEIYHNGQGNGAGNGSGNGAGNGSGNGTGNIAMGTHANHFGGNGNHGGN